MPIFSANRVSGAGHSIVAAEGYTERDFGRILSECAINDMRLFNAAIARDFKEAQAMNEGTMVASEIQALQEFSVKEAWKGLKEKLKKLWMKIKGVFKSVYAKLSLWLNRNTKMYIAQHQKELLRKDCSKCPIPKFRNPENGITFSMDFILASCKNAAVEKAKDFNINDLKDLLKGIDIDKNVDYEEVEKDRELINNLQIPSVDEMYEGALNSIYKEPDDKLKFGDSVYHNNVRALFDNLSGASKYLKNLKKANKELDTVFKNLIKKLEKAEKETKDKDASAHYKLFSSAMSKTQSLINAMSAATIKVVKFAIKNDRALIATLVAYNPKAPVNDSALFYENAFSVGFQALNEETDDMTPEEIEDAAEEEGITIDIEISGDDNVTVNVEDETDGD